MFEGEVTINEDADGAAAETIEPKPRARAARRVVDKLADKAVTGAARKVAATVRKAASKKPHKPKAE
jgi:hypothetical protein